ncbi:MAG: hypothetical protein KDA98_12890, partial [Acidimicrobiales bacterium]|nr:hypothetical protein [Acidimicrobiales bacterium]
MTAPVAPARPRPDTATALRAEYRLLLRSIATRGRIVAIGALAALSVLTALFVRLSDPSDPLDA